ncbi:uncharacterized protein LOC127788174 [Diospyros lotus]|uniref:uncharacterized protein LOC127788174 n=1 Tax=Diospyros lotus TaxID=55363 RepID=UPI00225A2CBB|nr:uncharacterized protein LOC127788174 [Diospyros lotus]
MEAAGRLIGNWSNGVAIDLHAAYEFLRVKGQVKVWAKFVWNPCLIPKHSFLLWLCARGRLLTRDRLLFLDIDRACPFCCVVEESSDHLFFLCSFNRAVWLQIKVWFGMSRVMSSISSAIKWISKDAKGSSWICKVKRIALACSVYQIWGARNCLIFYGIRPTVEGLVCRIKTFVYKVMFTMYPQVLIHFEALASDRSLFVGFGLVPGYARCTLYIF